MQAHAPAIDVRFPAPGRLRRLAVLTCVVAAAPALGAAVDIGKLGPTYPVTEQSFLSMIEERLRAKAESGEMTRLMERAATHARDTVAAPAPVAGLVACSRARTYYFDPSVVLSENIFDGSGHLLFPAGTRQNPLDVVALSRPLLFFDARDPRQQIQALRLLREHGMRIKLILTGGSYLSLMRQWRTPVFYDQQGLLSRRLGLKQVPALVSQQGQRLRIDEIEVTQ
jgi:conjugal transfer pilus assembly protein TraW